MEMMVNLIDACNITTGKLDANQAVDNGQYPFFTCNPNPLSIDTFAFDCDAILLAGNNAKGNFHIQRYKGKFNAYQRTYVLTAKDGYDIDYLYYSLIISLSAFTKKAQGSQTKFLTMEILNDFKLRTLDFNQQVKLVSILKSCDRKINNNNHLISELESLAKTIYDYWFLQFEFPNEDGKPYKSSGGKMIWSEELKREIPEGWGVEEIGENIVSNRGVSYSGKDILGGGIPMINLNSYNTNSTYKPEGLKTYSGEYDQSKILKPYDLVMCNTQQTDLDPKKDIIGKSFLVPDIFDSDIVSTHHVTTIKPKNEELKYYLNSLFHTEYFHKYISGYVSGTSIMGLDFSGVTNYKIPMPTNEILKAFAQLSLNIEKMKSKSIREINELTELRDYLLPMLMNGQVGFKE